MYRSTVRLRPPTLRRPMLKNPRGANSSSLARFTAGPRRPQYLVRLDTAAVTDRRHRRLVDGDEYVLPVAAAVAQLRDANAAEQAERAERPLTLVTVFAPERCAGPQLHLVQDDARIGVRIADDQDVVDDCLRSLLNGERHVGARPIVREGRCDDDLG